MTKKQRLPIYKRALEIVEGKSHTEYGLDYADGLCLWLPCLWLNPKRYSEVWYDEKGKEFSLGDVPKYFPEFGKYYPSTYPHTNEHLHQWRIDTLKSIIAEYENPKH